MTHTGRLSHRNGDALTLEERNWLLHMLQEFAARDEVRGVVLDLDGDSGLDQDYQQWDRHKSCAPAANIVAEAIHDLVGAYRHADPKALEYLTIVGSDAAVPFRRVPDHAAGMPENNHNPPVMDLSESRASFARGYVLTQDYYGSSSAVARQEHDMYVPGVAVGRAGESVEDIVALFDAYKASDGVSRPQAALASGYTFMQDLAELEAGQFEASGLLTDRLINNSWTAEDLRGLLSAHDGLTGSPYGILALNFHAAANGAVGGDYESDRPTIITPVGDIQGLAAHGGFANALILSIGCHFGYNIVDADAIPKLTDKIDFTQVFAAQGATLIGNTGYGYGDTLSVEYSERLLVNLTQQLRYLELNSSTPESVPIGKALVRAKRAYLDRAVTLTGLDEKAMEELTLYGLPMWKVALADGRIRPAQASLQAAPPPVNPRALASVDVSPTYALALRQQATARAESSQVESYFANTSVALDHDVNPEPNDTQAVAFRPIVPRVAVNVGAEGLLARGVALLAADYDDRALFSPLVSVPVTESEGVRPSVTANEFAPDRPYALNALSQSLVVTPFQFRRRAKEPSGIARVYERDAETGAGSMLFRVYYSPMRDRAAGLPQLWA